MAIKMAFWRKWREDKSAKDMAGNDVANFNFELWRLHVTGDGRCMKTYEETYEDHGEGSSSIYGSSSSSRRRQSHSNKIDNSTAVPATAPATFITNIQLAT